MFLSKQIRCAALAIVFSLGLGASALAANAQPKLDLSAFAGKWQVNLANTKMGRMGPNGKNIVRNPTFTWVFTPDSKGLQMDVYTEYPQPAPTRTMTVITDGKARPCLSKTCLTTGGDPKLQTYAYWQMDSLMLARLFYTKGEVEEYSTYAVSSDGKILTIISWNPATPQWQNIQVFDKQP
jgi:hypothetical protein